MDFQSWARNRKIPGPVRFLRKGGFIVSGKRLVDFTVGIVIIEVIFA